jgi:prophage regulatory protein
MSKLMRLPEVVNLTGVPRSSLYAMVRRNQFPQPIRISERAIAWRLDEVEQWIEARTNVSRLHKGLARSSVSAMT